MTPAGADVESASSGAIAGAVHSFLHPDLRVAAAVNAQFGGKKQTPKKTSKQHKLAKSKISVLVLNAGSTPGEAENTSYRLMTHGYTTKTLPLGRPGQRAEGAEQHGRLLRPGPAGREGGGPAAGASVRLAHRGQADDDGDLRTSRAGPAIR